MRQRESQVAVALAIDQPRADELVEELADVVFAQAAAPSVVSTRLTSAGVAPSSHAR